MPVNRNALIRYTTLDNCLRNKYRKWTLDDLIDACSEALYEFEGIDKGVSKRTVQMDLQIMRSEKLGYNAPIVVIDKKYYTYSNSEYSITNIPLTDQDLGKLSEVVTILKQFKGFTHFKELSGMLQRLEDKVHTSKTRERSIIDLEKNESLKGLEFIDPIYQSILKKKCLNITYQSFKARHENTFVFHPILLKEHRNRWFVLGKKNKRKETLLLALDRIINLSDCETPIMDYDEKYFSDFFQHVIGVSVNEGQAPQEIVLLATHVNAPYLETKPLHHSQKTLKKTNEGTYFSLFVQHNFELERDILAFGDRIKVVSPPRLRSIIMHRLSHSLDLYKTELNTSLLKNYSQQLEAKGSIINDNIYTKKEIGIMGKLIKTYYDNQPDTHNETFAIRELFIKIPQLASVCLNSNLKKILSHLDKQVFLTKAIFFTKLPEANWYVTWHQDLAINVMKKIDTNGYSGWTVKENVISVIPPEEIIRSIITIRIHLDDTNQENGGLKIITGSHKKRLTDDEIKLITNNALPTTCDISSGGIQIMKPLLLHASNKSTNNKPRRVIHLEFSATTLPNGLAWREHHNI